MHPQGSVEFQEFVEVRHPQGSVEFQEFVEVRHPQGSMEFQEFVEVRRSTLNTPPRKCGIPGILGSQTLHPKYTPKEVWNSRNSWKSDAPPQMHPQGSVEFQEFVEMLNTHVPPAYV